MMLPQKQQVWIELNGKRLATAQSLKCTSVRNRKAVFAFGEAEPVAWLERPSTYRLELKQLSISVPGMLRTSLHELTDFRLVTMQDGKQVLYTGCEWAELEEQNEPESLVPIEHAVIVAARRIVGEG